jgi:hypothetical protein
LRNSVSGGSPDLLFAYGFSDATPLIGNWLGT